MSQSFIGEIRMFGGNFAPVGWAFCDGSLLAIDQNDALFNLIGTTYGGDGQSTFALPNLQGRIPIHQGPGFTLGQTGGAETVTLTRNQMPIHTHTAVADSNNATTGSPVGNVWAAVTSNLTKAYATTAGATPMNAGALATVGGSQPHDNMKPYLAVNFIISLFGTFPSQS
ncbi:MAG TPA: tail fiber protein [Chloroflexota bacterium]|jgi:microcystin-dependent protein|nr:tail fiber protein [Chloroflexota bacterium]